jgi:tetratricopeptide (TPR) repeat protein
MFAVDSFEVALSGDGNNPGFLDVIGKYGSTAQGNVAKHYAGICYLKLGDVDAALEYLAKYKVVKGLPAQIINAQNIGLQGDIYADKGDYEKAVALYKKAVEISDNSFTAPIYLKKEGLAYDKLGKTAEAIAALQKIVDLYPASMEAQDAFKFMGAEEQK